MTVTRLADLFPERLGNSLPVRRLPGEPGPTPKTNGPLLGRLEGELPVPAVQEFRKIGVLLAHDAQIVHWVPSTAGVPDHEQLQNESAINTEFNFWFEGLLSAGVVALFALMAWSGRSDAHKGLQK